MDPMHVRRRMVEMTPEQQAQWEAARREAEERDVPDLLAQMPLLDAAAAEPTLSGQLRQAIHTAPFPLPLIAQQVGIETGKLGAFLRAEETLPSDVMDRLATVLGYHLMPLQQTGA